MNLSDGRVTDYTVNTQGIPITAALERAEQELPTDARELWGAEKGTCYQAELTSPILGQALATPDIGDPSGDVFVEMDTVLADGSSVYESTDVNEIMLSLGTYTTPSDAGAC